MRAKQQSCSQYLTYNVAFYYCKFKEFTAFLCQKYLYHSSHISLIFSTEIFTFKCNVSYLKTLPFYLHVCSLIQRTLVSLRDKETQYKLCDRKTNTQSAFKILRFIRRSTVMLRKSILGSSRNYTFSAYLIVSSGMYTLTICVGTSLSLSN